MFLKIPKKLGLILMISIIIRILLGYFLELGNDEVYYWTFLQNIQWSYFDHPAMFVWLSKFFSFGFETELALRFSSIIIESICIIIFYNISIIIFSEKISILIVLLFVGSIYNSIISGIFFMPDAPLNLGAITMTYAN